MTHKETANIDIAALNLNSKRRRKEEEEGGRGVGRGGRKEEEEEDSGEPVLNQLKLA
jgi:hypothetical protein